MCASEAPSTQLGNRRLSGTQLILLKRGPPVASANFMRLRPRPVTKTDPGSFRTLVCLSKYAAKRILAFLLLFFFAGWRVCE